ncbi:transposase-like zinc-binding domain-containing protein [Olivibacter sitiensis]|uniref:transposase-like zinc-binding domain-containing protein n=1 Tax=Olivibacter sitiensis TaxID=376470 RepID=UPI00041D76A2|nr:helix-turn-helix domain-containing protein [Olivibacter sitiensis]
MDELICPRCFSGNCVKGGIVNDRQRYKCKSCNYYFTVNKLGKRIDGYYIIKALQLYLEGISYREIERILGISHVSVMNWVKQYGVSRPSHTDYRPTYRIMKHEDVKAFYSDPNNLKGSGMILTELGDKFMLIKWERFKE